MGGFELGRVAFEYTPSMLFRAFSGARVMQFKRKKKNVFPGDATPPGYIGPFS